MALIGYARVSTREQNDTSQTDQLTAAGCERIFRDKATGKAASRPEWDRCREYLRPGDTLVVTRLSRIARSVRNLTEVAAWLAQHDVGLVVLQQHLDTRRPEGRLVFHILGAVDEFTADLISENTKEGLAAARARGRKGGRPPVLTPDKVKTAQQLVDAGELTMARIADIVGCSTATLYRSLGKLQVSA